MTSRHLRSRSLVQSILQAGLGFFFACCSVPLFAHTIASSLVKDSFVIDSRASGPAFAEIADIDQDGEKEIIVTKFGNIRGSIPNGEVTLYKRNGDLGHWRKYPLITKADNVKFPNQPFVHDVSKNGKLDIVIPTGFFVCEVVPFGKPCGGLILLEQKERGFVRHDIVKPGASMFFHGAIFADVNGNGIEDLITVGERKGKIFGNVKDRAVTLWFKGIKEAPYFESTPRVLAEGLGSIPVLKDITGNGKFDLASGEYFNAKRASFSWLEQLQGISARYPNGLWKRHIIDDNIGPTIMFKLVDDLYGDGKTRGIGTNHTNTAKRNPDPWESAVYVYDMPNNPRKKWKKTKISKGIRSRPGGFMDYQMAPGIFGVGDLLGNGLKDVLVSGDGDDRVFLLEQRSPGNFITHALIEDFGQAGAMKIADIDNDGKNEALISSYETNELMILKLDR